MKTFKQLRDKTDITRSPFFTGKHVVEVDKDGTGNWVQPFGHQTYKNEKEAFQIARYLSKEETNGVYPSKNIRTRKF